MMKRHLLLLGMLMVVAVLAAQDRYCTNYGDYLAGNWQTVDGTITLRSEKDNRLAYTLQSDDKRLRKQLRRSIFCLQHHGTLYVNLRNSRCFDEVFVQAYELSDGSLLFARPDVTRTAGGIYVGYGDRSVPFSTRGFKSKSKLENLVCYMIAGEQGSDQINFFKVTEEVMRQLLLGNGDVLNDYLQLDSKRRDDADIVLDYLSRAEKIKK